jgi:hypothetical protein
MTDNNSQKGNADQRDANARLDRELDAALAKYATAEPRPNLQDRILANLRAEQKRAPEHARWRWAAAAMAVLVLFLSLTLRSKKPEKNNMVAHQSPATAQTQAANQTGPSPIQPHEEASQKHAAHRTISHLATAAAASPKLDQFPSPRPLSEQEAILARYVTKYPQHAALIAQARTEELRRDSLEEIRPASPDDDEKSPQPNK